jgi:anti-sigma factor RsiW
MTPHCSVDELAAFVGGQLSGAQVRQVEGHLDACARCRRFISALVKAEAATGEDLTSRDASTPRSLPSG